MATKKVLPSFDDIIKADRKKRKNENLASQILGKGSNAASKGQRSRNLLGGPNKSLASRMGVTKRSASAPRGNTASTAWSQARRNNDAIRQSRNSQSAWSTPQAAAERGRSGHIPTGPADTSFRHHVRPVEERASELSIRGMAGPYTVVASNFAPGTTAADISAVMEPVGGEMLGCRLVSSNPTVIAEMIFSERDGAENVVAMFNNKRADGRLLYVYLKVGGPHRFQSASSATGAATGGGAGNGRGSYSQQVGDLMDTNERPGGYARSQERRSRDFDFEDERYGFTDMSNRDKANTGRIRSDQGLFSDRLLQRNQNYRR